MKALRPVAIALVLYVGLVVAFESLIGFFQPADESTLVITTRDREGRPHDRVLTRLESGGQLYVAANHWPRRWYRQALANPEVRVASDGATRAYRAVPVTGEEHRRVAREHDPGIAFRVLTGFPPRRLIRLDPGAAPDQ